MTKDEALDLALEALKNVTVTGPDDDGLVWINLPGNGTTGKAILRVGKAGLIAAQCAKLYEEQRTKAITAIKQARAAPVHKPYRPLQDNGSQYFGGSWDTLPTQSAPVQEPVAWVDLLKQAEEVVRSKSLWKKYIDGTPLANDIAVWMASFAQEHTTLPAQPAPVHPVAWCTKSDLENMAKGFSQDVPARSMRVPQLYPEGNTVLLYTTLPAAQRQWVGLTDEEILKLAYPIRWQEVDDFEADKAVNFAQMVEAKLRSKNNG